MVCTVRSYNRNAIGFNGKMRTRDGTKPEVITAKWKTSVESKEDIFGTITLDDEFQLRFPMLDSFGEIPFGTSVLWGITDRLKRCTALSLPFGPPDMVSNREERMFSKSRHLKYLIVGRTYISEPTGDFVSEMALTPQPNKDLHIRCFDPVHAEQSFLFETSVQALGTAVSASADHNGVRFFIRFQNPRDLQTALDEANLLCVFLSFLVHQYVYPTGLHVWATGEDEPYEFHCRSFGRASERESTWIAHTMILPDDQPAFSGVLQKWYATNETRLRSRHLYRYSLKDPFVFSPDRFLALFQAIEGVVCRSGYTLMTKEEMDVARRALKRALPESSERDTLISRRNNSRPLDYILKQELPKLLGNVNLKATFDVDEFVNRIYSRRNKSSHGGRYVYEKALEESLVNDTLLLSLIYLVMESGELGLDAHEALKQFRGSFNLGSSLIVPA